MTLFNCPLLSTSLLFLILFASINSQTTYSQNPVIHQVCARTNIEQKCMLMLGHHARSSEAHDAHDVGEITLDLTKNLASRAINYLRRMISETQEVAVKGKLETCKVQYNLIYDNTMYAYNNWTARTEHAVAIANTMAALNRRAKDFCADQVRTLPNRFRPIKQMNIDLHGLSNILETVCS